MPATCHIEMLVSEFLVLVLLNFQYKVPCQPNKQPEGHLRALGYTVG